MSFRALLRPRPIILMLLWLLPSIFYITIGAIALYQNGWLTMVAVTLPVIWFVSWLVARFWPPTGSKKVADGQRISAKKHWTPQDIEAIQLIEQYRDQVPPLNFEDVNQSQRYWNDVTELAKRLTDHYFRRADKTVIGNLTLVELLAVVHLAAADIEDWVAANVPGSKLVKIKTLTKAPAAAKSVEWAQNATFVLTALANPARLASYPIWKMSGRVFMELRHELLQSIYQQFLRQVGFYLIEMYSGRLRGGSHVYEQHFRRTSAMHYDTGTTSRTTIEQASTLSDQSKPTVAASSPHIAVNDVTIAIMGQVKAGKSSLLNHLLRSQAATTSVLPETREVSSHSLNIPGFEAKVRLLDTPGYSEDGAKQKQLDAIRLAAEKSNILLLVLSAVSPAKQADAELVNALREHYVKNKHLQPPPIVVVLTHIDQLSPRREWTPPYNWRKPKSQKEQSIAEAAAYVEELFGQSIREIICVYTGEASLQSSHADHKSQNAVLEAMVPVLVNLLPEGQSAAVLCTYYQQLGERRMRDLLDQFSGLGNKLADMLVNRLLR